MCELKYSAFSQHSTNGGWLAAIFHNKNIMFSDQDTPRIDTRLTHTKD